MKDRQPAGMRRFGYVVSILVNAVLLFVANNMIAWGWFSWLTDDFEQVLPALNTMMAATIVANVVYLAYDGLPFKTVLDLLLLPLNLWAALSMWRVFPFDFAAYGFNWDLVVRAILVVGILGVSVGIVAGVVSLIRQPSRQRTVG